MSQADVGRHPVTNPATAPAVAAAMADIRAIEAEHGITRDGVEAIRDRLIQLTDDRSVIDPDDFPPPSTDEKMRSRLYLLAQDDDARFALYANASKGATSSHVHDHTTWAVIVGFDGEELNKFYDRAGDGVNQVGEHLVEAGTGVAMLPDDLHSIHIDGPALNFHCYGLGLEQLDQRRYLAGDGTWKVFPAHPDIVEARPF